jgi:hypothetical protein
MSAAFHSFYKHVMVGLVPTMSFLGRPAVSERQ